ncbi:MAG: hypothetical protein NTW93_00360 [Phycisphaerae bacterium]|nr:hypothetical protein [Phycisphaerae bacterium]
MENETMDAEIIRKKLISEYKSIYEKQKSILPKEFFKDDNNDNIPPTIPWIGKNYSKYRILIYASAENLNENVIKEPYFKPEFVYDRHRVRFEKEKIIGIEPFDTDGLKLAALIALQKLKIPIEQNQDVAQCIAVANLSKFSLKRKSNGENNDIKLKKHILASQEYLKLDFKSLGPQLVINASNKEFPSHCYADNPSDKKLIEIIQYTNTQRGFAKSKTLKKISVTEAENYAPDLSELIKKYSEQLPIISNKIKHDRLNLNFVKYFYFFKQKLDEIQKS